MYRRIYSAQLGRISLVALSAAVIGFAQKNDVEDVNQQEKHNESVKDFQRHDQRVPNGSYVNKLKNSSLSEAVSKSRLRIQRCQISNGAPGMVVAVSVDGETVWEEGFGFADVENGVVCTPETVMRIASISKSITMTSVAKLWEEGKLDLDKPVHEYVEAFPQKTFNNQKVVITGNHLVSHTSGIRHYNPKGKDSESDPEAKEFYIKENFSTVNDALKLFKDDDLIFKPGTDYLYTTHGWTLVSAIVESVVKIPFPDHIKKVFLDLGMRHTYLDVYEPLIFNRARYYVKNKKGLIENAPYVDNSYKWAGGGFLSRVSDLTRFGNVMLYSYQQESNGRDDDSKNVAGYLKKETVTKMWTPNPVAKMKNGDSFYGMGWCVTPHENNCCYCKEQKFVASHAGGALGCSSVLLIVPRSSKDETKDGAKGVVVAILTNLLNVGLSQIAMEIANDFSELVDVQS